MTQILLILTCVLIVVTGYAQSRRHHPTPTTSPTPSPAPGITPPPQAVSARYTNLTFDDEFNGPLDIGYGTDGHKWNSGLWWEPVMPADSYSVSGGVLTITANGANNPYVDLCTQFHDHSGGKSFLGGYFEARMICNDWSAFWLFSWDRPWTFPVAGMPLTYCNEIDIIETDGGYPNDAVTTLHMNTSSSGGVLDQQNSNNNNNVKDGPLIGQWHTYGVLWTQSQITWYVDNVQVCTYPAFASTWRPAQLILTAAPNGVNGSPSTVIPPVTQVDWVRVWQ